MNGPFTVELLDGRTFGPADEHVLRQWAEQGRVPPAAKVVAADGQSCRAIDFAPIAETVGRIANAPPTVAGALPSDADPSGVSTIIPYRNGFALAGYYVSIASLIPCVAVLLGPVAIGLGIAGLRSYKANPAVKGNVHSIVAICLGSLTLVGNIVVLLVASQVR